MGERGNIWLLLVLMENCWWYSTQLTVLLPSLTLQPKSTALVVLITFRSVEGLLWGTEPRFELGPAVQQADALLSEPRRTLPSIISPHGGMNRGSVRGGGSG